MKTHNGQLTNIINKTKVNKLWNIDDTFTLDGQTLRYVYPTKRGVFRNIKTGQKVLIPFRYLVQIVDGKLVKIESYNR